MPGDRIAVVVIVTGLWLTGCAALPGSAEPRGDLARMARATTIALEDARIGETRSWKNPHTGHRGTVMPLAAFRGPSGLPCRLYQQTLTAAARTHIAYGLACRRDGTWSAVDARKLAPRHRHGSPSEPPRGATTDPYPTGPA